MAKTIVRMGREGYRTRIESRHHVVYCDEKSETGDEAGPTPSELLLGALGGCMAITARLYAERKGWPLEGVEIALDVERFAGKDYPAYAGTAAFIHQISEHMVFHGPLTDEQRARLQEITARCPVHRIVENPAVFVSTLLAAEENEAGETAAAT